MSRKALVTGASGGIGEHLCGELARRGYSLVLVARRKDKLEELAGKLRRENNIGCEYFVCDLSKEAEVEELIKTYPDIDVLINNAGFGMYGFFQDMPWPRTRELLAVNILSPLRLAHHYLPGMINRRYGRILNVASTAGLRATPFLSAYCGTKAFMVQFSKSLALEMNDKNVRISCLLPGPTATGIWETANAGEKVKDTIASFDDPRDVASFGIDLMESGLISGIPGLRNKIKQLIKSLLPEKIWFYAIKRHMTHSSLFAKTKKEAR